MPGGALANTRSAQNWQLGVGNWDLANGPLANYVRVVRGLHGLVRAECNRVTTEPSDSQQHFALNFFAAYGGLCWANKERYAGKDQASMLLISQPSHRIPNNISL